jgi:SAM-dependent methyltransferase
MKGINHSLLEDPSEGTASGPSIPRAVGGYFAKARFQVDSEASRRRWIEGEKGQRITQWAMEHVRRLAGTEPILDLACGNGRHMPGLLEITPHTFAGDLSFPMLQQARMIPGIEKPFSRLIRFDSENLPFENESFGVIYCARFFHHLPTREIRERILAEMFRTARCGIVMTFKVRWSWEHITGRISTLLLRKRHVRYYVSVLEVLAVAHSHGWRMTDKMASGPFLSSTRAVVLEPGS